MAGYLSDEWFDLLGATPDRSGTGGPEETLVLQHVVTGAPLGDVHYYVQVGVGSATIVRGQAPAADVTFAEDFATAAAVASGELSAAAALLAGRIRVGGDMASLIARRDLLEVDDPVPPEVRATTTYPEAPYR